MSQAQRPAVGGVRPTYAFTYNAIGLPTQSVDATGITTTHAYDSYGDLTGTTEGTAVVGSQAALNLTTSFTIDSWGNATASTTPLGYVSNATYDLDHHKLMEIEPLVGSLSTRTASKTIYDADGRAIEVDKGTTNTSGGGFTALETTLTAYDPNGNKAEVQVLNGGPGTSALAVSQMSYDPLNRPICTAVRETSSVFGSLPTSACTQSTSANTDHITELVYDLAGQKLNELRGVGSSVQITYGTWTYGQDGEVLSIVDANANKTAQVYDSLNRLSQMIFPSTTLGSGNTDPTNTESYSYDANDNRLSLTKRDGTLVSFAYDALNRRTAKTFPSTGPYATYNVAYGYDLSGRPLSALYSGQSGTPGVTWSYDAAGRRITEATMGRTLTFAWDNDGDELSMTWPDSVQLSYAYDSADRFSSVGTSGATVSVGYDSLSRITSVTRGQVTTAVAYDNADRLASLAHSFPSSGSNQTWTYSYSPASQVLTSTSANSAWNWTGATPATTNVTPDGLNRNAAIAAVGSPCAATGAGYNCNGDLTYDGVRTFTYDEDDRLLSESGPVTMALTYDPTGRLQQSVINGTATQFLYDGPALVAEYDTNNDVLRRYAHGSSDDNPVIEFDGAGVASSNASYYLEDRQGSIAATANASGALSAQQTYDAFGVPNQWTGTRFRYTGQIVLPEAQLYYYKARVYDPVMGRFLQADPDGYSADMNLYAYVGDDPVDREDPTGMRPYEIYTSFLNAAMDAGNDSITAQIRGGNKREYGTKIYQLSR